MFPLKDNIPTERFPAVTVALIVINALMYLFFQKALQGGVWAPETLAFNERVVEYGAIPYEFTHPGDECGVTQSGEVACVGQPGVQGPAPEQPPTALTALTSMFMHGSLLHIGGNMLFLWIFGNNVEDSMGRLKFVAFYLLGGFAALAAQTAVDTDAAIPTVGASGAVAGVLGGYILCFPRARVVTVIFIVFFFTIVEIPALFVLGFWFLEQIAFGALDYANPTGGGGGVAYFAHIGGFVFGLALIKLFVDQARVERHQPGPRYPVY